MGLACIKFRFVSCPLFSKSQPHDSTSVSEQHVVERAVLASEIEQLPDLAGYLKLASSPAWLRVNLPSY